MGFHGKEQSSRLQRSSYQPQQTPEKSSGSGIVFAESWDHNITTILRHTPQWIADTLYAEREMQDMKIWKFNIPLAAVSTLLSHFRRNGPHVSTMFAGLRWLIPSSLAKRMGFVGKSNCLLGLLGLRDAQAVNSQVWESMPWKETYRLVRQASRVLQAMKKTHQKRKHMEIWKHYETLWIMKLKSQVKKYQKYKSSAPVAPLQVHSWRCEPSPYCARLVPASELLDGSAMSGSSGPVQLRSQQSAFPHLFKNVLCFAQPFLSLANPERVAVHNMAMSMPTSSSSPTDLYTFAASSKASVNFAIELQVLLYFYHATQWGAVASPRRSCDKLSHLFLKNLFWHLAVGKVGRVRNRLKHPQTRLLPSGKLT